MRLKTIKLLVNINLMIFSLVSWNKFAVAEPIVIGIMEGYSPLQYPGWPGTEDINEFNTKLRDSLILENYYSRVFDWDDVQEVTNYFNLFNSSTNYLLGYSRGGYQALRVANELNQYGVNLDRLVLLDPVRCGGTGIYDADNVSGCISQLPTIPSLSISDVVSSGPQIVPDNVVSATNYFQTGGGITGERNVIGATNINVNEFYNDDTITHSTIDNDRKLREDIISDISSFKDNNVLMTGIGGQEGFGTPVMTRNDDGSTSAIELPFEVNLNGNIYTEIFVNNNGNITFGGPYGRYTPTNFDNLDIDMIAPYWSDVDTRCENCGEVYLAIPTSDVAVITWNNVGYYYSNSSKQNTFQLVIRDRNDLEGSNTDVEFRYGNLEWTTGDASGGQDGLGGQSAIAGYTGGAEGVSQTLVGSGTSNVLTLNQSSNKGKDGRWYFPFREGASPGTTPLNPLLPNVQEAGWHFQFNTTQIDEIVWSDPEVVFGYDFMTLNSLNFRSFILPELGDNYYQLWLGDEISPLYIADIMGGTEYSFSDLNYGLGVDFFSIRGIDMDLKIDPDDVTAFVTGLTFMGTGQQEWIQRPLSEEMDTHPVDEPHTVLMVLIGIIGFIIINRKKVMSYGEI